MKKRLQIFLTFVFLLSLEITFAQGGGYMIDLGSSGDNYINCGSPASLEISAALTVEVWIYPTAFNSDNEVYAKVGGNKSGSLTGNNYSHSIELRNGTVVYRISHDGTSMVDVSGSTLTTNKWYHLALTFDGTSMTGYVNGKQDAQISTPGTIYTSTSNPFLIGSYMYYPWPFRGKIDEVRVWNTALSQQTIQDWMHKDLTNSHPNYSSNLKGYWKLNETSGTTVADASGNSATGTLVNTGTWSVSTAPIGSEGAFVNTTSQTNIGPSGGQLKTTISSTPDNSNNLGVYQFGSVSGTPVTSETPYPAGVDKRSNIVWGIAERGTVTANLVFDYSNVAGIETPSTIKLIKRTDASSSTWTEVTLTARDDVAKTMTVSGVTDFSEFAIGAGSDNALPVELTSFTGIVDGNKVVLNWATATEVNNYGFEVERNNLNITKWEKINFVQGHGNSNSPKEYSFIDKPLGACNFNYRLKQIDFDGQYEYSPEVEVNLEVPVNFSVEQNFPNPFNPTTKIEFAIPTDNCVQIKVYNILGMELATLLNEHRQAGTHSIEFNASNLSSGIYFYKVVSGKYSAIKKMILLR